MKNLVLVRHAKSSWDDDGLNDFDRPLSNRGEHDAPSMAKRLKGKLHPDAMISSAALRARTTCEEFADVLKFRKSKIMTTRRLYLAEAKEILEVVREIEGEPDCVLLFGHNPGITDFANRLLNGSIDNIPTCGVVSCKVTSDHWKDVGWGSAVLDFFDFPKKKD